MSGSAKMLSNPISTGGGGAHFEAQVQACFVSLMLTGGHAPCLPCWPITEIKLQGKIDGYDTDDLIVYVKDTESNETRKLLGQIKHAISVTKASPQFGEVIQAAWNDFNNPEIFFKNKDCIALITGPLSKVDDNNVRWLLNKARHTKDCDEFLRHVRRARFSPAKSEEKLDVIRHHLAMANGGDPVADEDLYQFLRHFYILGFDLGYEVGVVLSLLHSHISQFENESPELVWSHIVNTVQMWNKNGGTVTVSGLPENIRNAFSARSIQKIPEEFRKNEHIEEIDWAAHEEAYFIAIMSVVGSWNENSSADTRVLCEITGFSYDDLLNKARGLVTLEDSPFKVLNGVWSIDDRIELWSATADRLLDNDLQAIEEIAVSVLREVDPALDLDPDQRFAAGIYGKTPGYSPALRQGVAEGLAILGNYSEFANNVSVGAAEASVKKVLKKVLEASDWKVWASLNNTLPVLAESSPEAFLECLDDALGQSPSPIEALYRQEGDGIMGRSYVAGLLWALEGMAWEEQWLVRVCVVLGELANRDPGGQLTNRPENSLTDILLPWRPHTFASLDKRRVAVETVLRESPEVGWRLLLSLLPGESDITSGTYTPKWRAGLPSDFDVTVTKGEFREQSLNYANMAIEIASGDIDKLGDLVQRFDHLPRPSFDGLLEKLGSEVIQVLPQETRYPIWSQLSRFVRKHRRFPEATWSLSDELLTPIEGVMESLAPSSASLLYRELFSENDFDLYEYSGDWDEQRTALAGRRKNALAEIVKEEGVDGVLRFGCSVKESHEAGRALARLELEEAEEAIVPLYLNSKERKNRNFASAYVRQRYEDAGWGWCDSFDRGNWAPVQTAAFLESLPFCNETWLRAEKWLDDESRYWKQVMVFPHEAKDDIYTAVDKLLEYDRPYSAIGCLERALRENESVDIDRVVRALMAAVSSEEKNHLVSTYQLLEMIEFVQSAEGVDENDLFQIEWRYLPLLHSPGEEAPVFLNSKLANDPAFFCELIQIMYRAEGEEDGEAEDGEVSEERARIATNAYRLLDGWDRPPGVREDGSFDAAHLNSWVQEVRQRCSESGHLEAAMSNIGSVMIHAPGDQSGLWINRSVAEVLNGRDADKMRDGFAVALFNSRGIHTVDPSGQPELELAEQYRKRADEVENAGFHRLASTLNKVADSYVMDAEHIRSRFSAEAD